MTNTARINYEHHTTQLQFSDSDLAWAAENLARLLLDPRSGIKSFTVLRGEERWEHFYRLQTTQPERWEALKKEYTHHTA